MPFALGPLPYALIFALCTMLFAFSKADSW